MPPVSKNINCQKKIVPKDEHLQFPYTIYLYQKVDGLGFALEKYLHLTYFKYFIQKSHLL